MKTIASTHRRRGAALLLTLFVIAVTSLIVVSILDAETSQFAAVRNASDYERALYLAGAAVHHALAMLEADLDWRGVVSEGSFPADDSYQATAANGDDTDVVITGIGVAGSVTRRLQVSVSGG